MPHPLVFEAMFLLKLDIFLDKSVDSIYHALDQFNLRITKAMLVRNVISDT